MTQEHTSQNPVATSAITQQDRAVDLEMQLPPASPDDFLPPIGKWTSAGGWVLVAGFISALGLSAVLPYTVTVQAEARVRPAGELRIIQATAEGNIERIAVQENQVLAINDILVEIDDSALQTRQRQLEGTIERNRLELEQLTLQLETIEDQISAYAEANERNVSAAEADLSLEESNYLQQQLVRQADFAVIEAEVSLAREEFQRFQQLAESGGVSQLQVLEREASLNASLARLERARALLEQSRAGIDRAAERVAEIRSTGMAELAALIGQREGVRRELFDLEARLQEKEEELTQVQTELLDTVVRTPVAGIVQELNIRNIDQVVVRGDEIATILPTTSEPIVEVYVASRDINTIALGQAAQMRVSSCPFPDFGTLDALVVAIFPDISADRNQQGGGEDFYRVLLEPSSFVLNDNRRECAIRVGMQGRVDIETARESVLQFALRKARLLTNL